MMNLRNLNNLTGTWLSAIGLVLLLAVTGGCSSLSTDRDQSMNATNSSTSKPGVQLWAENCAHCHNIRPPDSYGDAQWDVAVLHMRVRADLNANDARAILEYLKSAN